jgi:histidinol phosphatase-like PHP family hydrolase
MEIINPHNTDYHIHSSSFSDGTATIEEIVKFA